MGDRDRSPRRSGMNEGRTRMKKGPVERRIFINNLPYESKWQEVKDLFRREVGEVNFVELFNDEQGRPRGAGIMEFASVDLAKKAIEKMNKHDFAGRKIVVKEDADVARDKHGRIITEKDKERFGNRERSTAGGRGQGSSSVQGGGQGGAVDYGNTYGLSVRFLESLGINVPLNQRIFVSNLSYDVDERKLKEVFRLSGTVVAVDIAKDKEGKSRGFAIIVYDHPVEAVQAISMFNDQQLFDRRLAVRMDKVKEVDPPRNMNRLPDGLSNVGMGLGDNGAPLWDVRNNLPSESSGSNGGLSNMSMGLGQDMAAQQAAVGMQNNNTAAALQTALATIMSVGLAGQGGAGGSTANLLGNAGLTSGLSSGMTGSSSGMSAMDLGMDRMGGMSDRMGGMSDRLSGGMTDRMGGMSDRMLGMSDRMGGMSGMSDRMGGMTDRMGGMGDRMSGGMTDLKLGLGGGMDMDRMGGGMDRDRGMMGASRDRGGMSSMGGASGGMTGARGKFSDKVIVRNLPDSITWQNLKDKFKTVGDIKYAEIKERGCGVIRFATEREAERAVGAMNRQRLDGRTLEVALY